MKTRLRKSLHRDTPHRLQISTPLPLVTPPPAASIPPKKVIRAIAPNVPTAPDDLPFQTGDCFYVTRDPGPDDPVYEAQNPVTGARGLVPKHLFEEFFKSPAAPTSPPRTPRPRGLYAVVLHNFVAERADELDASAGDFISVVAHSNREWFVAKPICSLGRPGLIPASFVQLRDPASNLPIDDVDGLVDRGDLPRVEDWKKAMITYKQNSISLGVIDDPQLSVPNSPYTQTTNPPFPPSPPPPSALLPRPPSQVPLPDGILLSAEVVSFHHELSKYWFRIHAIFQPYDPYDPHVLPKAKQLVLFRPYDDFYRFQLSLLDAFPHEAGREAGSTRILPFMPGPADEHDDEVTALRRRELDQYIHKLCDLNAVGASYILEHQLVRTFLAPKGGDVEYDISPCYDEISALFSDNTDQDPPQVPQDDPVACDYEQQVRDTFRDLKLSDQDDRSDDSHYAVDRSSSLHSYANANGPAHQRSDTASSIRHPDALHYRNGPVSALRSNGRTNVLRDSRGSGTSQPDCSTSSPTSLRSSQPSFTTRSRSHSSATTNLNAPPMSAGNPQIAFVKIKIFDRVTDDLIAIRVHPRVTHSELMTKVQTRLGTSISSLRYRNSLHHEFIGLEGDRDLRDWIQGTEKHVLYAD